MSVKIITQYDPKPIPQRNMDWTAVSDNYDCDCDEDGFFSSDAMGFGATEQEAIEDLKELLDG